MAHIEPDGRKAPLAALTLGATGIVFGDIGTSPLYTIQECFGPHGVAATYQNVLGIVSLVVWAVTMVVTVKYLLFVMRADNRGEGGILALLALIPSKLLTTKTGQASALAVAALAGAALLFGDGIITPAISVLSAMEGLQVAAPELDKRIIVGSTVVILLGLFLVQSRGTTTIGRFFGPIMVVWFATIGLLGGINILRVPEVLHALNPIHGLHFFRHNGWHGFTLLGAVVLAVTGGEALYADMGHFGRKPIRIAWLGLIYPALLLCYLGQGAVLIAHPEASDKPFFNMLPQGAWTYALVAIAAPATVIASQALISGVFSLTRQAIQLGYFPRVDVRHTSSETEGQIYVPFVNVVLAVSCLALVVVFQHSSKLAAAFGLAVSGTMAITSVLFFEVMRRTWQAPLWKSGLLLALFLAFDLPFFIANLLKFVDGGYLPLAMGAVFLVTMLVWRRGRTVLGGYYAKSSVPLDEFVTRLRDTAKLVLRTPGAGIFMASSSRGTPPILAHFVERLSSVPEKIALLTIVTDLIPYVKVADRLEMEALDAGVYRLVAHVGFMEEPRVSEILELAVQEHGLPIDLQEATFFVGRETLLATNRGKMGVWAESFFAFLSKNARSATLYFGIPSEQVVEVGIQIDL